MSTRTEERRALCRHDAAPRRPAPRRGSGVQPGDLDFRQRLIRGERAWSLGRVKDTKTHEARTVDRCLDVARVLREHLSWLTAEALRRGWGQPESLFPSEVGRADRKS